jgi:hypothetical protein
VRNALAPQSYADLEQSVRQGAEFVASRLNARGHAVWVLSTPFPGMHGELAEYVEQSMADYRRRYMIEGTRTRLDSEVAYYITDHSGLVLAYVTAAGHIRQDPSLTGKLAQAIHAGLLEFSYSIRRPQ